MRTQNYLLPKILLITFIASVALGSISVYAINKAKVEVPDLEHKIETALRQHYKTDNIHINFNSNNNESDAILIQSFDMPVDDIAVSTTSGLIKVTTSGKTQKISFKSRLSNILSLTEDKKIDARLGKSFGQSDVELELPANFTGKITLTTVSGDIDVDDLSADQIEVVSVSGDVSIKQLAAQKAKVHSVSGDVEITQKISGEIFINSISGSIDLRLTKPKQGFNLSLKSVSGEIENTFGTDAVGTMPVEATTTSGDITIKSF